MDRRFGTKRHSSAAKEWRWWWLLPRLTEFLENVRPFIPLLHFFSFFFNVEIISHTRRALLCQDQSAVAQRAERTVAECSLTSCAWARFRVGSHTMRGQRIISPLRPRWVKGVCVFRCSLPNALLAEWPRSLSCHCSNTGMERTPNKIQHTKLTLQKKIYPPLLPGFELATFRSRVRRSYPQAIPDPSKRVSSTKVKVKGLDSKRWNGIIIYDSAGTTCAAN